jgi:glycerol kinase
LTQSATRAHICLAALKAVAFQTLEMVEAVEHDMADTPVLSLKVGSFTFLILLNLIILNNNFIYL